MQTNNILLADFAWAKKWQAEMERIEAREQTPQGRVQRSNADIEVVGMLFPKVPKVFGVDIREFGVQATGYDEIEEQAAAALASKKPRITMMVDSGGGYLDGLEGALKALRKVAGAKALDATVGGGAMSAAYWLASAANTITASRMSLVGSIGVFVNLGKAPDGSQIVVRSAPHKGAGVDALTAEQIQAVQDTVDAMGDYFLQDVVRARNGVSLSEIKTGKHWIAAKAKEIGLVDNIDDSASGMVPGVASNAATAAKETKMNEEMLTEMKALREQVATVAEKQANTTAILKAFAEDPAFAVAQINAGATIEQAQAAYTEVLKAQVKEAREALAVAQANSGAEAVANTGGGDSHESDTPANWSAAVAFVAKRDGIAPSQAGRIALREFPHLHPVKQRGN